MFRSSVVRWILGFFVFLAVVSFLRFRLGQRNTARRDATDLAEQRQIFQRPRQNRERLFVVRHNDHVMHAVPGQRIRRR